MIIKAGDALPTQPILEYCSPIVKTVKGCECKHTQSQHITLSKHPC